VKGRLWRAHFEIDHQSHSSLESRVSCAFFQAEALIFTPLGTKLEFSRRTVSTFLTLKSFFQSLLFLKTFV
ncbi:hypothetical protein ACQP3D_29605, partial [Escherichia coli]